MVPLVNERTAANGNVLGHDGSTVIIAENEDSDVDEDGVVELGTQGDVWEPLAGGDEIINNLKLQRKKGRESQKRRKVPHIRARRRHRPLGSRYQISS